MINAALSYWTFNAEHEEIKIFSNFTDHHIFRRFIQKLPVVKGEFIIKLIFGALVLLWYAIGFEFTAVGKSLDMS